MTWQMLGHVLRSNYKMYFQVGVRGENKFESDCIWEKNAPGEQNAIIYDMWPCNNKGLSSCVLSVKGKRVSNVSWMGLHSIAPNNPVSHTLIPICVTNSVGYSSQPCWGVCVFVCVCERETEQQRFVFLNSKEFTKWPGRDGVFRVQESWIGLKDNQSPEKQIQWWERAALGRP